LVDSLSSFIILMILINIIQWIIDRSVFLELIFICFRKIRTDNFNLLSSRSNTISFFYILNRCSKICYWFLLKQLFLSYFIILRFLILIHKIIYFIFCNNLNIKLFFLFFMFLSRRFIILVNFWLYLRKCCTIHFFNLN